jgi:hypothetical protein
MSMTPEAFVAKYTKVTVNEKAAVQTHFNELCELLGVPKPLDYDPTGHEYRFEKHVSKIASTKKGYADVWWRGRFGWEYKGKDADLNKAYQQLGLYRDDLDNPPLLVVSDMATIEVHTTFTGMQKVKRVWTLDDLLDEAQRNDLRKVWTEPQWFNPTPAIEQATVAAVDDLAKISVLLKARGEEPDRVAHFLVRTMFTLFAEDVSLIPDGTFTRLLTQAAEHPDDFQPMCEQLFAAMKTGAVTMVGRIPYINGGVFDDTSAPVLLGAELRLLRDAARRSWRQIDPTIFGTLFELVIDPTKRWQLGAHYTPLPDILDVVEPVVMRPLRAEWDTLRAELAPLIDEIEQARAKGGNLYTVGGLGQSQQEEAVGRLRAFQQRLAAVTVLDPAMGSGNFLYVTLRLLLDLEAQVRATIRGLEDTGLLRPPLVSPRQLLGLEINPYAHEIAGMVLWIGYLQWLREHGEAVKTSPVLDKLSGLRCTDAVMVLDADDQPTGEIQAWPKAEFIVGNPPFLGYSPMREQLGTDYVDKLRKAFEDRIPGFSDFVCFFFEQAREQVKLGHTKRVGLIATNSIAGGENARVLERINQTGAIFRAWPDRAWIQSGAAVRTSVVMFDDGSDPERVLLHHKGDEREASTRETVAVTVTRINADLSSGPDLRSAQQLEENAGRAFIGVLPTGTFDVPSSVAQGWLTLPNPDGVSNTDVLKRFYGGDDINDRDSGRYTVDFTGMTEEEASRYEEPFEHIEKVVKPFRASNRVKAEREQWWLYARRRPEMYSALGSLSRFLVTSRVSKYRNFVFLESGGVPGDKLVVIASDEPYVYGVLNSALHELWARRKGSSHGVGNDLAYTPSTTFETFPFPRPTAAQRAAIEKAATQLENTRAHLMAQLDPKQKTGTLSSHKNVTLTGAYNLLAEYRSTGVEAIGGVKSLDRAHTTLDAAVAAAYGWSWPLSDDELLGKLLALNLLRAAVEDVQREKAAAQATLEAEAAALQKKQEKEEARAAAAVAKAALKAAEREAKKKLMEAKTHV